MAIREIVAMSPTGYSLAGRVSNSDELAREVDKMAARIDSKLSILSEWVEHKYKKVTTAYTLVDETVVLADATGAAFAVLLPPSNTETINRDCHFKRLNAGGNAVTVTASGTDTIDGAATNVLGAQYANIHIISDGAGKWHVI